jgi:hypothetical protein
LSLPLGRYPEYVPLTAIESYDKLNKIQKRFGDFAKAMGYSDVVCRKKVLLDIIERVEKRKVYFRVFHGIIMSERNEISLYCFWILKLAPFFDRQNPDRQISARFALFLFLKMIDRIRYKINRTGDIDETRVNNLFYAFLYQDISKEAIMLAADTLLA